MEIAMKNNRSGADEARRERVASRAEAIQFGLMIVGIAGVTLLVERLASGLFQKSFGLSLLIAVTVFILPRIAFSGLERVLPPAGPRKSAREWMLHVRLNVFHQVAIVAGAALLGYLLGELGKVVNIRFIDLRLGTGNGPIAVVLAMLLSMLVSDFIFYWYHRFMHRSPFMWEMHKIHHSDEKLDEMTSSRNNMIDSFAAIIFMYAPVALLFQFDKLDAGAVGAVAALCIVSFRTILGSILHMNVKWSFGRANAVLSSPQVHRIHHSRLPEHRDKNFAGTFPIYDIIFGTYYGPAPGEYPPTGVDGEADITSLWDAHKRNLDGWWNIIRERFRFNGQAVERKTS